jgi:hypothetical protein
MGTKWYYIIVQLVWQGYPDSGQSPTFNRLGYIREANNTSTLIAAQGSI